MRQEKQKIPLVMNNDWKLVFQQIYKMSEQLKLLFFDEVVECITL